MAWELFLHNPTVLSGHVIHGSGPARVGLGWAVWIQTVSPLPSLPSYWLHKVGLWDTALSSGPIAGQLGVVFGIQPGLIHLIPKGVHQTICKI